MTKVITLRSLTALTLLATACGGLVRDDRDGSTPSGTFADATTGVDGSSGGRGSPFHSTALPDCHPGFDPAREPAKPCAYVFAGLCYDTKDAACGCACPRKNGTVCVSGLPSPGGHTRVICE